MSLYPQDQFRPLDGLPETISWFLSTSDVPNIAVGQKILPGAKLPIRAGFKLPYRLVGVDLENETKSIKALSSNSIQTTEEEFSEKPSQSLVELGILESDSLGVDFKYPIVRGRGQLQQALAVCEMAALQQQVPFRRDAILKVLEGQFRRDKSLSLQLIAGLLELLGLNCQIAEVDCEHLLSVEAPAVFFLEKQPVILYANKGSLVTLGHPEKGLVEYTLDELKKLIGERLTFALPRRVASTPKSRFGWRVYTSTYKI